MPIAIDPLKPSGYLYPWAMDRGCEPNQTLACESFAPVLSLYQYQSVRGLRVYYTASLSSDGGCLYKNGDSKADTKVYSRSCVMDPESTIYGLQFVPASLSSAAVAVIVAVAAISVVRNLFNPQVSRGVV